MKNKNWMKSAWAVTIGGVLFSFFLSKVGNRPIISSILQVFKKLWSFIILVLNFKIKVWWLMIGIICIVGVIYLVAKSKKIESIKPDFYNYRDEVFKNWRWSWTWSYSADGWYISNLTAHCPRCDTPLIDRTNVYGRRAECPRCNYRAVDDQCEEPSKIKVIILDNIERARKTKAQDTAQ